MSTTRRDFLKASIALSLAGGLGDLVLPRSARAVGFPPLNNRVLVNISLDGGPDMRHIFPPAWDAATGSYGRRYWEVRARAHQAIGGAGALQARWDNDFFHIGQGRNQFGILRKCGFLKDMWEKGQAALVQNVYGATTRDHSHATQVVEQGNSNAPKLALGSGWGGRLAAATGGHVLALSNAARPFTFGPDPLRPTDLTRIDKTNLMHIANTREINLYSTAPGDWLGPPYYLARSVKSYYAAKGPTVAANSPFLPFVEHERKLRQLGTLVDNRLAGVPRPDAIEALTKSDYSVGRYLAVQARNLYDVLASQDLLNLSVASLEFPGWDTHDNQFWELERNAEYLFGSTGVLAALQASLPPQVWANVVIVLGGEFGRQLRGNGASGTDHGVGTTHIVLGPGVRGGVYGDLFPEHELARLDDASPDIKGQTAIEQVYGPLCDWVQLGSRSTVFPNIGAAPLETGSPVPNLMG